MPVKRICEDRVKPIGHLPRRREPLRIAVPEAFARVAYATACGAMLTFIMGFRSGKHAKGLVFAAAERTSR